MSLHRDDLPRGLVLMHEAFKNMLDGSLLKSPVDETVTRVLDIGTGCGIWAAEFATEHPGAEVIGIDNYPQPKIMAPSNCHFIDQDAEKDWNIGGDLFDVIHTRLIPFHSKEWRGVLSRCYEHLKPGGFLEMQESWPPSRTDEPPGAPEHASKVIEWTKIRLEAASKLGIDQGYPGQLPKVISETGFVDVQTRDLKWPIGPWMEDERNKELGNINLELLRAVMMGLSVELLAEVGMDKEQVTGFVAQVKEELGVGKIYGPVRIVWARKPQH